MIKIDDFQIFKDHLSTLKETSRDNHDGIDCYMTDSLIKVINFDDVKASYVKDMKLKEIPKSNDALYVNKDGGLAFIEFKNGLMDKEKEFKVRLKIFDSLLIFTDIIGQGVSFTRSYMDYILVYNESKNPAPKDKVPKVQDSKSRVNIGKYFSGKANMELIRFNLERFKKLYFKEVHTYTEREFENKFVDKLEEFENG